METKTRNGPIKAADNETTDSEVEDTEAVDNKVEKVK